MNENNNGVYVTPDNGNNEDGEVLETSSFIDDAEPIAVNGANEADSSPTEEVQGVCECESVDDMLHPSDLSAQKKRIADHICEVADGNDCLREKIAFAVKSGYGIDKCYDFIKGKARALAVDGVAMIEDDVVYGWAVHYYEDEWIAEREKDAKEAEEADRQAKEAAERAAKWKAEEAKREAERKAEEAKAEEEKLAAMTADERIAYEREKARREAEEAERMAAAERAAAEADRKRAEREEKRRAKAAAKMRAEEAEKAQMTFF